MTLTTLDPRTALIVVDLQKGIVATPVAHPADEIVARAAELVGGGLCRHRRGPPPGLTARAGATPWLSPRTDAGWGNVAAIAAQLAHRPYRPCPAGARCRARI